MHSIARRMILTHCSAQLASSKGAIRTSRPTILQAVKRQSVGGLSRLLRRGRSRREVLPLNVIDARVHAAGVNAEWNRWYHKNECFACGMEMHKQRVPSAPKASRVRRRKASMARATARCLSRGNSPHALPPTILEARRPRGPRRLPPIELEGTRPPHERWVRRPILLRLKQLRESRPTTRTLSSRERGQRVHREGAAPRFSTRLAAEYNATSFRIAAATGTRVAALARRVQHNIVCAFLGRAAWRKW